MKNANGETMCDDCGGFDIEWMHRCSIHKTEYCRGCECPVCEEAREIGREECGMHSDGYCPLVGTEQCDFECPFRHDMGTSKHL